MQRLVGGGVGLVPLFAATTGRCASAFFASHGITTTVEKSTPILPRTDGIAQREGGKKCGDQCVQEGEKDGRKKIFFLF
jgi:hypothetical protein